MMLKDIERKGIATITSLANFVMRHEQFPKMPNSQRTTDDRPPICLLHGISKVAERILLARFPGPDLL